MPDCPICKAEAQKDWRPFCSKRCADLDLGRWLDGKYAIPTEEPAGIGAFSDEKDAD